MFANVRNVTHFRLFRSRAVHARQVASLDNTECVGCIPKFNACNVSVTPYRAKKLRHATGLVKFFQASGRNATVPTAEFTNASAVT